MGFTLVRQGSGGRLRYVAHYHDLKGRQRSAGNFSTRKEADRAWQRAEAMISLGRVGDPARGRQTFRHYVEETWLPNHEVEPAPGSAIGTPVSAHHAGVRSDFPVPSASMRRSSTNPP